MLTIFGCSSGDNNGVTPPANHPPDISWVSHPGSVIAIGDPAYFSWQATDEDGNFEGYFLSFDGAFNATSRTDSTFSELDPGSSHVFKIFAADAAGLHSDTLVWSFSVEDLPPEVSLVAFGQGMLDADQDGFWSQFAVEWSPQITTGSGADLRLLVGRRPTYGVGVELLDSTDLVSRDPGQTDTLTYLLPAVTKNYYDIRLELHDDSGEILVEVPYNSIAGLTRVGLEDVDGAFTWFDDAWTANAVDLLPVSQPDGYYESIDLWCDVDAYSDAVRVKVILYERNSAGEERYLSESYIFEVQGLGDDDAVGFHVIAGTTFDVYDYRFVLRDESNNLLDVWDYGIDPDLLDIPLGNPSGVSRQNTAVRMQR
jgi:hypothetical protein